MKNKKYLFNLLLLKYNKYKAKLLRFRLTGRNEHRQSVLEKHIERLSVKLNDLLGSIRKVGAVAAVSTALVLAAPNSANAQVVFAGQIGSAEINPFGLTDAATYGSNSELIDIDGDGDLDLMSGSSDGNFYYYENIATAGNTPLFDTPTPNPFGLSDIGSYSTPEIIDIDGDGDLDLISGAYDGNFYYFRNIGSAGSIPSFAAPQTNPFGLGDVGSNSNPDFEDLDGDGDLDLMSTFNSGNILYFENTAAVGANTPAFAASVTNPFGLSYSGVRRDFDLEDIDSDGDLDLMWSSNTGFRYYENTAGAGNTPAFASYVTNPFGLSYSSYRSNINIVDIDGDGDLDLMSGNGYTFNTFSYFENVAGAGNTPDFSTSLAAQINPFGLPTVNYTYYGTNADLVDIDGDGDLDMMSGSSYSTNSFYYYENTAGVGNIPSFDTPVGNPFGLTYIGYGSGNSSNLVDLDGDGDLDLMSGNNDGNFYYFRNIGSASSVPSFAGAQTNPFGLSDIGYGSNSNLVDLDGDGDLDLMSGSGDGNFFYFENTANSGSNTPVFAAPVTNPFGLSDVGFNSNSDLVDLDGDGDLDLMSGGSYYGIGFYYFENTAGAGNTPSFAAPIVDPFNLSFSNSRSSSNLVDFDADGDLDLMSGSSSRGFYYYENVTCTFDPLTAVLDSKTDLLCFFQNEGAITLSASGATAPYQYSIDGGANISSTTEFDNLAPGSYDVLVVDANGCEATLPNSVVINAPDSITIASFSTTSPSNPNAQDGTFTIVPTGGTGQLDVVWSNGQMGNTATFGVGEYEVTITDDNNCERTFGVSFGGATVSINSLKVEDLAIYPNPTSGLVTVSFETTEQMDVEFNVINTIGKTVFKETAKAVNGSFTTIFNLSNLGTGVYFLQLNNGKGLVTKKITISK